MNTLFRCKQITKLLFFVLPFSVIAETNYEPNDSLGTASEIFKGELQTHTFKNYNDEDWLVFRPSEAIGASHVDISLKISNFGRADPELTIYDENGTEISVNSQGNWHERGTSKWWTAKDKLYYIKVTPFYSLNDHFDIVVSETVVNETNNLLDTASEIFNGEVQTHKFENNHDEDWLVFKPSEAIATNHIDISIEISNVGQSISPELTIYDENGTKISVNHQYRIGLHSFRWWPAKDKLYYIKVTNSTSILNPDDHYDIVVSEAVISETNNLLDTASEIFNGEVQTHKFENSYDEDWLIFRPSEAIATSHIEISLEISNVGQSISPELIINDENGTAIYYVENYENGQGISYKWLAKEKLYYIKVTHSNPNFNLNDDHYDIVISETEKVYEPNNTLDNAQSIYFYCNTCRLIGDSENNPEIQKHNFADANDVDWMFFEVDNIFDYYSISIQNVGSDINPTMEIYDWTGRLVGDTYKEQTGIYYIKVFNSGTEFGENNQYEIGITAYTPETDPPENGRFSGSIYDQCTQTPIHRATVSVDSVADQALSVKNGYYEMFLLPGIFEITVNKEGYQKQTKTMVVESHTHSAGQMNFNILPNGGCSDTPITPQESQNSMDILNTARYNDLTKTLVIDDVTYESDHYQAELINSGDYTFSLKSASKLEGQTLQNQNVFDLATSSLKLNKVFAFGKHYKVVLKHLGDFVFKLESAEEISE